MASPLQGTGGVRCFFVVGVCTARTVSDVFLLLAFAQAPTAEDIFLLLTFLQASPPAYYFL
ncbi:MAG: hypothetical protein L6V93_20200 [Clostridiales bacterium]|nr:MAG: hypothetical protein L6V93_20200 [Clostridiales bacterium]